MKFVEPLDRDEALVRRDVATKRVHQIEKMISQGASGALRRRLSAEMAELAQEELKPLKLWFKAQHHQPTMSQCRLLKSLLEIVDRAEDDGLEVTDGEREVLNEAAAQIEAIEGTRADSEARLKAFQEREGDHEEE